MAVVVLALCSGFFTVRAYLNLVCPEPIIHMVLFGFMSVMGLIILLVTPHQFREDFLYMVSVAEGLTIMSLIAHLKKNRWKLTNPIL
jgi:hypothetical protein